MPSSKHVAKRHPNALATLKHKMKREAKRRELMRSLFGGANAFDRIRTRELSGPALRSTLLNYAHS